LASRKTVSDVLLYDSQALRAYFETNPQA
jgi:hypothetical protein